MKIMADLRPKILQNKETQVLQTTSREVKPIIKNKGLEIGSCPIKMVDNLSSLVDFSSK